MKKTCAAFLFLFVITQIAIAQVNTDTVHYFKQLFPESGLFLRPNGLADGKWIAYCEENPKQIGLIIYYRNGKPTRESTTYWSNGQLHSRETPPTISSNGKSQRWYRNGVKEREDASTLDVNLPYPKYSIINYWTSDGKQVIKDGTGEFIEYHPNGTLQIRAKYVKGLKEGEWKWYRESGKILYIENFVNGLQHGNYVFYFENGQIRTSGQYQNGKMEGIWNDWDTDGKQISSANRNNGALNGEYTSWYVNGNLKSKGIYKMGKEDGKWEYWKKNGSLDKIVTYSNGIKI